MPDTEKGGLGREQHSAGPSGFSVPSQEAPVAPAPVVEEQSSPAEPALSEAPHE